MDYTRFTYQPCWPYEEYVKYDTGVSKSDLRKCVQPFVRPGTFERYGNLDLGYMNSILDSQHKVIAADPYIVAQKIMESLNGTAITGR